MIYNVTSELAHAKKTALNVGENYEQVEVSTTAYNILSSTESFHNCSKEDSHDISSRVSPYNLYEDMPFSYLPLFIFAINSNLFERRFVASCCKEGL